MMRGISERKRRAIMAYAAGGGAPAFSPASLFAAGEVGAWYDPSDLTTLFRDTAGTLPVTAPGDTVALVLDKSRGLVAGSELTSGAWANSPTIPWDTFSASGGGFSATKSVTGTQQQASIGSFAITAGRLYAVELTVSANTFSANLLQMAFATGTTLRSNSLALPSGASVVRGYLIPTSTQASAGLRLTTVAASTGSVTVTGCSVRELFGNHATQDITTARPTYRVDAGGRPYLEFDGTDDFLVTGTITPGTDKAQVFAGVRKLSDAATVIVEHSANINTNNGALAMLTSGYSVLGARWGWVSKGTVLREADTPANYAAPITNVLTGIGDIVGDNSALRVNGTQVVQNAGDQGTGNYLAYPLYIGRRGGASLPLNGWLYGLIVRFSGANLDAARIGQTEAWLAARTGVTL